MVSAVSLGGFTKGGEPIAILTLETPSRVRFGGRALNKPELERVHLEKYRLDMLLVSGCLPFDNAAPGGDPPDFIVSTPSGDEGIDCTALALEKRRHAYDLFDRFRARLLDAARREPFPHLADCSLLIWFGDGADMPPKRQDQRTIDQLVTTLREARIDRTAVIALADRVAREGWPESLAGEPVPIVSAGEAGGANITPVEPSTLHGEFAQLTGFDIGLSMSLHVTASEIQAEVERIVRKHDKAGVQRLLITVGAPDRHGFIYPGESTVVDQLPPASIPTKHIRTLTMHMFLTGAIRDL